MGKTKKNRSRRPDGFIGMHGPGPDCLVETVDDGVVGFVDWGILGWIPEGVLV